jgi:hypothetical protein
MKRPLIALFDPSGGATFWKAPGDLSRVIYHEGPSLKETTIDNGGEIATATIAAPVLRVAEITMDAASLCITSRSHLDRSGDAAAGKLNVYLFEREVSAPAGGGDLTYLATLPEGDLPPGIFLVAPEATKANKNGRAGR